MKKTILVLIVLSMVLSVFGCNPGGPIIEGVNDIVATGTVYSRDTQTISLNKSAVKDTARFKESITKEDIVLEDGFDGKVVDSVEWISEAQIKVTLSGEMEDFEGDSTLCILRVKADKMVSGESSWCHVKVRKPVMSVKSMEWANAEHPMNITVTCTYTLSYGKFNTDLTRSDFRVLVADVDEGMFAAPSNGVVYRVAVSPSGRELTITIEEFNSAKEPYPRVVFPANATTFGKEITVEVGKTFAVDSGYSLH